MRILIDYWIQSRFMCIIIFNGFVNNKKKIVYSYDRNDRIYFYKSNEIKKKHRIGTWQRTRKLLVSGYWKKDTAREIGFSLDKIGTLTITKEK